MEFFCRVLIAQTLLSDRTLPIAFGCRAQGEWPTPRRRVVAIAGVILAALSLIALCGITILTLHSVKVRQQFERRP